MELNAKNIIAKLTSKDDKYACAIADKIIYESKDTDAWYECFVDVASLINHPKSLVRNRVLYILAVNAQWDEENHFENRGNIAMQNIIMQPIGYVHNSVEKKKDASWGEGISAIVLNEEYYTGLKGLEDFSHVIIIYYLDKAQYEKEKHLQRRPQNREDMPLVGIFSQRGKDRPNAIGMTSVQIVSVDVKSINYKVS